MAGLDLSPVDNQPTTYQIRAVFEGDNPSMTVAYATMPNGTQYPVCTTLQYFPYKPARAPPSSYIHNPAKPSHQQKLQRRCSFSSIQLPCS